MHYLSYPYLVNPYTHPKGQPVNGHQSPHQNGRFQAQNQFPPVDTRHLYTSAQGFQELMREAGLLVNEIVNSPEFAYELMNEAQQSNKKKVEALIASTGVTVKVNTKYTPTGIHIEFDSSKNEGGCCKLNMGLLW